MKTELTFELNGKPIRTSAAPHERLIDLLREELSLTGTKEGCSEGECGACTVIVDDRAINACLFPALEAEGARVITVEGLAGPGQALSAIQRAYVDEGGAQCGFCTPGMVMSTVALLGENPDPTDDEIRGALVGNLCRCTGYVQIIDAIRKAAQLARDEAPQ